LQAQEAAKQKTAPANSTTDSDFANDEQVAQTVVSPAATETPRPSLSATPETVFEVCSAGARPKRIPVSTEANT